MKYCGKNPVSDCDSELPAECTPNHPIIEIADRLADEVNLDDRLCGGGLIEIVCWY
jgi:hypothetical protein